MNAVSQRDLLTAVIFYRHQQEKKRSYNQRCMEVENGTNAQRRCRKRVLNSSMFLATLAEKLSVVRSKDVNPGSLALSRPQVQAYC